MAAEPWDDELSVRYRQEMESAAQAGLQLARIFDPDLPDAERRHLFDWYRDVHRTIRKPLAHSVPTADVIHVIGLFTPIVEIGAGSGYWANLIRERTGARVQAYDLTDSATGGVVATGNIALAVRRHPDATLLLCWPDLSGMASEAMAAYDGDTLLYIGESFGRSLHGDFSQTGDVAFHLHLSRHFHEVLRLDLPHWPGNRDCMSVYRRTRCLTMAIGESESIETFQHVPQDQSLRLYASSVLGDELIQRARLGVSTQGAPSLTSES